MSFVIMLMGEADLNNPVSLPVGQVGDGCNFDAITFDVFLSLLDYGLSDAEERSSYADGRLSFHTNFKDYGNRRQVVAKLPLLLMEHSSAFSFVCDPGGAFDIGRDIYVKWDGSVLKIFQVPDGYHTHKYEHFEGDAALEFWKNYW